PVFRMGRLLRFLERRLTTRLGPNGLHADQSPYYRLRFPVDRTIIPYREFSVHDDDLRSSGRPAQVVDHVPKDAVVEITPARDLMEFPEATKEFHPFPRSARHSYPDAYQAIITLRK